MNINEVEDEGKLYFDDIEVELLNYDNHLDIK